MQIPEKLYPFLAGTITGIAAAVGTSWGWLPIVATATSFGLATYLSQAIVGFVLNLNQRINELVNRVNPILEQVNVTIPLLRQQALETINLANEAIASADTLIDQADGTTKELTTLLESINGATQTTGTYLAPISYGADGFRWLKHKIMGTKEPVEVEVEEPEVPLEKEPFRKAPILH